MNEPVKPRKLKRRSPQLLRLEQRLMFDGAVAESVVEAVDLPLPDSAGAAGETGAELPLALAPASAGDREEVVFVDAGIDGLDALLDALSPDLEVVLIGAQDDGLLAISAHLAARDGIDAIHIVGHGSEGAQRIGSSVLDSDALRATPELFAGIGEALSADGDILLYGCNVASGEAKLFLDELAQLTAADLAASTDATGNPSAGGDWDLEHATGPREATTLFGEVEGFEGTLVAPTVAAPSAATIGEDSTYNFGSVEVSEPESAFMEVVATLTAGNGVLRGPGGVEVPQILVQGDRAAANSFFDILEFVPEENWIGTASVEIVVETDYTDADAGDVTTITIDITVEAINDAPTAASSSISIDEDTPYAFGAADFGFNDAADDPANALFAVLVDTLPTSGVLSLSATPLLAGAAIPAADIPNLLYTPAANANGAAIGSFSFRLRDDGGTDASGVDTSAPATIDFTIAQVNDPPEASDVVESTNKNTELNFDLVGVDVDAGENSSTDAALVGFTITSLPLNGRLFDGDGSEITVLDGSSNVLTIAQATGMSFRPDTNFTGSVSFEFRARDAADVLSIDPASVSITVAEVNEGPELTVPAEPVSLAEDTDTAISGISVADGDAGSALVALTLGVDNGELSLDPAGLFADAEGLVSLADGRGATLTVYGSIAALNTALADLRYAGDENYFGSDTLTVSIDDLGFSAGSGPGIARQASDTVTIEVTPVADAPLTPPIALPAIVEDAPGVEGAEIAALLATAGFADVDGDALAGLAVSANPDNSGAGEWQYSLTRGATWSSIGTVSSGSALLLPASAYLRFQPLDDYSGIPQPLTVHAVDDSGSRTFTTDPGAPVAIDVSLGATDLDSTGAALSTEVTAANDPLVIVNNLALQVVEGNTVDGSPAGGSQVLLSPAVLQVSDAEAGADQLVYTIQAPGTDFGAGELQFDTTGSGAWAALAADDSFSQADIDAGRLRYVHFGDEPTGAEQIALEVTDLVGGLGTVESLVLDLQISPLNDLPELIQATINVPVLGSSDFSALEVLDPDNSDTQLRFQLTSLPDPAVGVLTIGGRPVAVGSLFTYSERDQVVFRSVEDAFGSTSFDVTLRDGAGGVVDGGATILIEVGEDNQAPDRLADLALGAIFEDGPDYEGAFAQPNDGDTLAGYGAVPTDPDAGDSVVGVVIVGNTASAVAEGRWQYSTDAGTTWSDIGSVNDAGAGRVLPIDARLRFAPVSNFAGVPSSLLLRTIDASYTTSNLYSGAFSASDGAQVSVGNGENGDAYALAGGLPTELSISVTPVNDDPVLDDNAGLRVDSGGTGTITTVTLDVDDVDTPDAEISYTLTAIPGVGELRRGGTPLQPGDTFTQADINSNQLSYVDTATSVDGTTTSFSFTVADGDVHDVYGRDGAIYDGGAAEPQSALQEITFAILIDTFEPPVVDANNDAFAILWNTAAVPNELAINAATLLANDVGTNRAITVLAGLTASGSTSTASGSLSWDTDSGAITYTPDEDFVGVDSFSYTMSSDEGSSTATVTISVRSADVAPFVVSNLGLGGLEGDTVTITQADLQIDDSNEYDGPAQLSYTITAVDADFAATGVLFSNRPDGFGGVVGTLSAGHSFTQADIDAGYLRFQHDGGEDLVTGFAFSFSDGTNSIENQRFEIDFTAVNDAPVFSSGAASALLEEGDFLDLTNLLLATDADGGGDKDPALTAPGETLAAVNDLVVIFTNLNPSIGEVRVYDDNSFSSFRVVAEGEQASMAEVAAGLVRYQHNGGEELSDGFDVEVNDGTGEPNGRITRSVGITLIPVNDDPQVDTNTNAEIIDNGDGTVTISNFEIFEGTSAVLNNLFLGAFDPDNSATQLQFRIDSAPLNGVLLLGSNTLGAGSSFTEQQLLDDALRYIHDGSETTVDTFDFKLSDAGGGLEPSGTFDITIIPVNDAPVLTLRPPVTAVEDSVQSIGGISIRDKDIASGNATLTLSVSQGVLTLASTSGLSFLSGSANGEATLVLSGTVAALNSALATLSYQSTLNFNSDAGRGDDTLTVSVSDGGGTGTDPDEVPGLAGDSNAGEETDSGSVAITVISVNDAPEVLTAPGAQTVAEEAPLTFSNAAGTALSIDDVDAAPEELEVSLSVNHGSLSLSSTTGLSFTGGTANGGDALRFRGSLADINAALASGFSYQGELNFNGSDQLAFLVNDLGNQGTIGGELQDHALVDITVTPVNDAPVAAAVSATAAEDGVATFSLASSDVDAGTDNALDAVVDAYVIDSLPSDGILRDGDNNVIDAIDGSTNVLTLAQATGMTFTPSANFNGSVSFQYRAVDAAAEPSSPATVTLTITPVNDAPVLSGGGDSVSFSEGSGAGAAGVPVLLDANGDSTALDQEITEDSAPRASDDFDGATLILRRSPGPAVVTDRFEIVENASVTLSGGETAAGADVSVNGDVIGRVEQAGASGRLELRFNAAATQADVEAVMQAAAYNSVADAESGSISVAMFLTDGNTGAQGSGGNRLSNGLVFTVEKTNSNDSPQLGSDGALTQAEDVLNAPGLSISALVGSGFSDPDSPLAGSTFAGVVIVDDASDRSSEGYWQYFTPGGDDWYDVSPTGDAGLTAGNGLLLDATTLLRFVPVSNFNSAAPDTGPGALTVMAVDDSGGRSYSSNASRALINTGIGSPDDIGVAPADQAAIAATITQVNDAPRIDFLESTAANSLAFSEAVGADTAGDSVELDSLSDDGGDPGATPAQVFDVELVERSEADFEGARLVVVDNAGADSNDFFIVEVGTFAAGNVSVVGGFTEPGGGVKLFNSGSVVFFEGTPVATITDNSADSGQLVVTFNDAATAASVNALVQSLAYSNDNDTLSSVSKTINVSFFDGNGSGSGTQGAGGEAVGEALIAIALTASNDAPSLLAGASIATVEDSTSTPATLGSLLAASFEDPDGVAGLGGVAVAAVNEAGLGEWQVNLSVGGWTRLSDLGAISASNALLLSAATELRFVPAADANSDGLDAAGLPGLTVHAVEDDVAPGSGNGGSAPVYTSDSGAPSFFNTTTDNAGSRVSIDAVDIDLSIAARNDASVIAASGSDADFTAGVFTGSVPESPVAGDGTVPQALLQNVSISDLDIATTATLDAFGAGTVTVTLAGRSVADEFTLEGSPSGVSTTSGGTGSAGDFVISLTDDVTAVELEAILEAIRFENTLDNPPTIERAFTVTVSDGNNEDGDGDTAGGPGALDSNVLSGSITILDQNNPPVVSATGLTPTYIEDSAVVSLYSGAAVDLIDTGNTLTELVFTISDLSDGPAELFTVDGVEFALESGIVSLGGDRQVEVLRVGGTATVTFSDTSGLSASEAQTLIDGVAYRNSSDDATPGPRTFTISSATDSGAGDDTASLAIEATATVVEVNDPPVVTAGGTLGYTENQAAQVIDAGLAVVSDADDTELAVATVRVVDVVAGDTLDLTEQYGITGSYDGATGVLTLTGTATLAQYEEVLRSVTFASGSEDPTVNGTRSSRSIEWQVTDANSDGAGAASSTVVSSLINVTAQTDNPSLTLATTAGYTENAPATVLDATLTLSDPDDTQLVAAAVEISDAREDDVLTVNVGATGLTPDYNPLTGILSLTGTASLAEYQQVLRTVSFSSSSDDPTLNATATTRTINVSVIDANSDSAGSGFVLETLTLTITPQIDAPVFSVDPGPALFTEQLGAISVDGALTVTDADDTIITGGTVSIGAGELQAADRLAIAGTAVGATVSGTNITVASYAAGLLTLTGNDSVANYEAVLQSLSFDNGSDNPTASGAAPTRTLTYSLTDANSDAAGAGTGTTTRVIGVLAVNDAPVLSGNVASTGYTENTAPVPLVDGSIDLTDVDAGNFAGGTLTVQLLTGVGGSDNYAAGDELSVSADGDISVGAGTISYQGTQIATFSGGTAGALNISFDADADAPAIEALLGRLTYRNTGENPDLDGTRADPVVTVDFDDGGNVGTGPGSASASNTLSGTLVLTPLNDAPTLSIDASGYTEDAPATLVDASVSFADVDSTNMEGGSLTVSITAAVEGTDQLSILAGAGITVSGTAVSFGGTVIGTISGDGANGGDLVVAFTDDATPAAVAALIERIAYRSTSSDPTLGSATRDLTFTVIDGDGTVGVAVGDDRVSATSVLTITPVNDPPVVTAGGTLGYTENQAAQVIDAGLAVVSDADDTELAVATVRVVDVVAGDTLDLTEQYGITGSYDGATGVLTLTGTATLAQYEEVLRSVTFASGSEDPTVNGTRSSRSIEWQVTDANSDGAGAASSTVVSSLINVTAQTDNPSLTLATTAGYTENAPATVLDATLTLSDPDDTQLVAAAVEISDAREDDVLTVNVGATGLTPDYNPLTGILSLTGTASLAEYQQVLRTVSFSSSSDDPTLNATATTRTINVSVIDANSDSAGSGFVLETLTLTITPQIDAPVFSVDPGPALFTEQLGAISVDGALTVTDADDTIITGGTVSIGAGELQAADRLAIAGTAVGATVSGTNITVASYAAGLLTLTGNDSVANYEAVLQSLSFDNGSDNPTASGAAPTRTLTYSLTDANSDAAGAGTGTTTRVIGVLAVNDAPVLSGNVASTGYTENTAPVPLVDGSIDLTDVDAGNFAGGTLTVQLLTGVGGSDNYAAGDELSVSADGDISVGAGTISYQGTQIATFSGGTAGALNISFDADADAPAIEALLGRLTYRNTGENPDLDGTRADPVVTVDFDDGGNVGTGPGSASASNTLSGTLVLTPLNDAPTLSIDASGYTEDAPATLVDASVSFADVDSTNMEGGSLTVSITAAVEGTDQLSILAGAGITVSGTAVSFGGTVIGTISGDGANGGDLVVAFTDDATPAAVAALIERIAYRSTSSDPTLGSATRDLTFTVIDGDGTVGVAVGDDRVSATSVLTITPVNDPPVVDGTVSGSFTESDTPAADALRFLSGVSITDPDATQFNGGFVDVDFAAFVAGDRLVVAEGNGITLSDTTVSFAGDIIGTIDATRDGAASALRINFSSTEATLAVVSVLLEQIAYYSDSENPSDGGSASTRAITVTLNDGGNGTGVAGTGTPRQDSFGGSIGIVGVNDTPAINDLDTTSTNLFVQAGPAVQIDPDVAVTDADLDVLTAGAGNWSGSRLEVERVGGAHGDDVLSASGNVSLSGTSVIVSGVTVGSFTNSAGRLAIDFNADATTARVNDVLRSLTYSNGISTPGALADSSVELALRLNDNNSNNSGGGIAGTGQDQGSGGLLTDLATITVNINRLPIAVNDAAVVAEGLGAGDVSTVAGDVTPLAGQPGEDTDDDGDALVVQGIAAGTQVGPLVTGVAAPVDGSFGSINMAAGGGYTYTLNNGNSIVQSLATGETLEDVFTYSINDGRGGTSTARLRITITGTDDAPIIIVDTVDSVAAGFTETNAPLTASGTVTVIDVDVTNIDVATLDSNVVIAGDSNRSEPLAPTETELLAMFSVSPEAILDAATSAAKLTWVFDSGTETFDYLATGEVLSVTYSFRVTEDDAAAAFDEQDVTITITGTNDDPAITLAGGDTAGATPAETDAAVSASGTLTAEDIDIADTVELTVTGVQKLGDQTGLASNDAALRAMLSLTPEGPLAVLDATETSDGFVWDFNSGGEAFDYLAAGQSLTLRYTITAVDSQGQADTQLVDILITGVDDGVLIRVGSGDSAAETVIETDSALSTAGTLTVSDGDIPDIVTASLVSVNATGTTTGLSSDNADLLSMLNLGANPIVDGTQSSGSLSWNFDSSRADPDETFDYLALGESLVLTYTVRATDDNVTPSPDDQAITITIAGRNDPPTVSATPSTPLNEPLDATTTALSDSGTVIFDDTDASDLLAVSSSYNGDMVWSGGALPPGVESALVAGFSASVTDAPAPGSVGWSFAPGAVDIDFLLAGETLNFSFGVAAGDGNSGLATDTVTFLITGSNDAPQLVAPPAGAISEDDQSATLTTSSLNGILGAVDPDANDSLSFSIPGGTDNGASQSIAGGFGTLSLNELTGAYEYTPDDAVIEALDAGESVSDTFTLRVTDGSGVFTELVYTVNVNGGDDAPTLAPVTAGSIEEDPLATTTTDAGLTGTLVGDDVDLEPLSFGIQGGADDGMSVSLAGSFGTLSVDKATGAYSYVKNAAAIESLKSGELAGDSFTFAASDGDGVPVTQVFTIQVTGGNDAPALSVGAGDSTSLAVNETNIGLSGSGSLTVSDVDLLDTVRAEVKAVAIQPGSVTAGLVPDNAALLSMLVVDPATPAVVVDGTEIMDALLWSFDSAGEPFDYLRSGETLTLRYTITATDGQGATTTNFVDVLIAGSDESTILSGDSAALTEGDVPLASSGTIVLTDLDSTGATILPQSDKQGSYGRFTLDASGNWSYTTDSALDFLNAGEVVADSFTVAASDGTGNTVLITVTGSDDASTISGDSAELVENDRPLTTSGSVLISDADSIGAGVVARNDAVGEYGRFSIDAAGNWTYESNGALNELNEGEVVTDTFTVEATDGANNTVVITITGSDDDSSVTGDSADLVETNEPLSATGTLTVSDDDDDGERVVPQDGVQGRYGRFSVSRSGDWTYDTEDALDFLNAGEVVTDSFTVRTSDGARSTVTITITGTEDPSSITGDSVTLLEGEEVLVTEGAIVIDDADGLGGSVVPQTDTQGEFGRFTLDESGAWRYVTDGALDFLDDGQLVTDSFVVTSADGAGNTVSIMITGTEDISTLENISVDLLEPEDPGDELEASGTLLVSDPDSTDATLVATVLEGEFGVLEIGNDGSWEFRAYDNRLDIEAGAVVSDVFTVISSDGGVGTITINIFGVEPGGGDGGDGGPVEPPGEGEGLPWDPVLFAPDPLAPGANTPRLGVDDPLTGEAPLRPSPAGIGGNLERLRQPGTLDEAREPAPWNWQRDDFVIDRGIPDQLFSNNVAQFTFVLPFDAFRHTDSKALVKLSVTLIDGSALPAWLIFDSLEERFTGIPPNGFSGDLIIKVLARDELGRQVETLFRLQIADLDVGASFRSHQGLSGQLAAEGQARDALILGGLQPAGVLGAANDSAPRPDSSVHGPQ